MVCFTIEVTNQNALKKLLSLEEKHFVRISESVDISSPALPGRTMSLKAFKNWIADAEASPSISLIEATGKWAIRKKQLAQSIK